MIKLTNEIINSTKGLSSGTYVVEDTIELSHDLIIPEDVTLIFQGGKFIVAEDCKEEISISGTNTRLNAPICTIFGKGINVVGSWDIDRAYPQWFELEDNNDWSLPINKAINMKEFGEVFLKSGIYEVYNSIKIPRWIHLVGESSQRMIVDGTEKCTIISPKLNENSVFTDGYIIHANTPYVYDYDEIKYDNYQYIDQSTIIQNICFTNWKENIPTQKCILAGGGVQLDRIVWYNFLQGVKYTNTYNDTRSITNCSFKTDSNTNNSANDYAIDTGWLGDALRFEHNAIHSTCNGKALKLFNCGGGSIQGNIINSDVLIEGCKAVVFNANHCESGMQMEIINSCVTTNNNYFHRGTKPNYYIHNSGGYNNQSVVSMNNDMFIHLTTSNTDYDICIDKETTLKISNLFRYDITYLIFDKIYPCGINICKDIVISEKESIKTHEPFEEFNQFSYITSGENYIQPGYNLHFHACIKKVNTPAINNIQSNGAVSWHCETGVYRYFYQIVWDKNRKIKKTLSSSNFDNSTFNIQWYLGENNYQDFNTITKNGNGVLITMSEDTNGNCAMVRLIREKVIDNTLNNSYQDVYVPICGSRYLYDNGISVCGYKWSEPFHFLQLETSNKNMEMMRINNGNVECFTKREDGITPTSGWKRGDVIHNISNNNPSTYIVPDDIA